MKIKHFDQFYQANVTLLVCSAEQFTRSYPDIDIDSADGITAVSDDGLLIWMPKFSYESPEDISVLVHECAHAVFFMALGKDIPLTTKDPPNSEQLAYSMDHLVLALLKKLRSQQKSKSRKHKTASSSKCT